MAETAGQVVTGRYRLVSELGRGGMGRVWRAHDETLGREVALKQLAPPDGIDVDARSDLRTRFRNEARTAGRLQHPGIVAIHDIVEDGGELWIVMQLVEGRSLHDAIRSDGPLPPNEVAHIGLALVDALDTAHTQGVIHRDVTPRNVLLARNGDVVLGDFGIAAAADITALTQDGAVVGTPGYMAPERLHGHPATEKSDLWSLGATLYQATEADRPFRATEPGAAVAAILAGTVTPPTRAGWLAPLLLHLLATDPQQRPDTAAVRTRLANDDTPAGTTVPAGTAPTAPGQDTLPPTAAAQPVTCPDSPGRDTLIQHRPPGPPTAAPPPAVFQGAPARRLTWLLAVSLLALGLGLGFLNILVDAVPDDGCNKSSVPARSESTLVCDRGDKTVVGYGFIVVTVLTLVLGAAGVLQSLWRFWVKPTLTIDDRGIDYRTGSKASHRRVNPQLPWHAIRQATVSDKGIMAYDPEVAVALGGHKAEKRLPRWTYETESGGHVLCRVSAVGDARMAAQIKAAIDAHTSYRSALGLHSVVLEAPGPKPFDVATALGAVADISLTIGMDLVESTPERVLERAIPREAEAARAALERAGATVTITTA